MVNVIIAGGGTGGHVFPMVAVGDACKARGSSVRVTYVGTSKGLEARVIPERGDTLELLDIRPLRGNGLTGFMKGVYFAAASIPKARALLRRLNAHAVLSVGGYAAGPVAFAAWTMGIPIALLEPNSIMGFSNRLLSPFCARAYTAFPEVESALRQERVLRAGVPLRGAFSRMPYGLAEGRLRILILGGSLGAKALNENIPHALHEAVKVLEERRITLQVTHQTGRDWEEATRALYNQLELGKYTNVMPFIQNMAEVLAESDLVIGRAGASSLAELCVVGRPSILIPYPFAADDHQMKNARSLEKAGASIAIPQSEATPARLAGQIQELALHFDRMRAMAEATAKLGKAEAAHTIAADLLELAGPFAARSQSGLLAEGSTAGPSDDSADQTNAKRARRPALKEAT